MNPTDALSDIAFQKQLAFGQAAETLIAKWLISRGRIVLPIYDIEYHTGKGPRVFGRAFRAAAPDLLVWSKGGILWCEAKHKSVFTWHRITGRWTTGIDLMHWHDYRRVATETGLPAWLLFLHRFATPDTKDSRFSECPSSCPVGLFGQDLRELSERINHTSNKHGRSGMIYWAHSNLLLLDSLENVLRLEASA